MKRNRLNSNRGSRTEMGENSRGAPAAHKDVKNEGRSGNVYENEGSSDTMTENYSGFCAWSAYFLQKLTGIQRAFWPNMHKSDDNWGEVGTPNRFIGPSVHRLRTE